MNSIFIYPYNTKSKSVGNLVKSLREEKYNALVVRTENSKYVHGPDKLLINWGNTSNTLAGHQKVGKVINPTFAVKKCSNKLAFFRALDGTGLTPEFTENPQQALEWSQQGHVVVARTELAAHSGKGIVFSDEDPEFHTKARLFVKYMKKKEEYRVHVMNGEIIDIQKKLVRKKDDMGNDVDPLLVNYRIRSYDNGFVFARNDKDNNPVQPPACVTNSALEAFRKIENLDFGAFDIIYNQKMDKAFVLECNTAPGIEGTTVENYKNGFKKLLGVR